MSQFFRSAKMPVGRSRLFAKSATLGGRKLHGSNQPMETNPLTFAKRFRRPKITEPTRTPYPAIFCQ